MLHGTVKSLNGMLITFSEVTFSDHTTLEVANGVTVTLNGRPAKLGDLQPGDRLETSGLPATAIDATR